MSYGTTAVTLFLLNEVCSMISNMALGTFFFFQIISDSCYFLCPYGKTEDKSNVWEKALTLAYTLKGYSPQWQECGVADNIIWQSES